MRCSRRRPARSAAASRFSSAPRPASARPTRCCSRRSARRREGVDVVVGVVETHGRAETAGASAGARDHPAPAHRLSRPRARGDGPRRGAARKPALVLVDELAHTNAPGSRHPKRYLDVEELLAAGIDVYTTLNIQHVESLNDVVAQITRIRVRETVPDSILDRADEIEVVDLTPDDLIQRLREGKVYVPEQAEARARPLLLARQSDRAARAGAPPHRRARRRAAPHAHAGARDRRAVAGGRARAGLRQRGSEHRRAGALRQAHRRPAARALDGALRRDGAQPAPQRRGARPHRRRACGSPSSLGGEAVTLPGGGRIADDVLAYARANNVTQIVIGKSTPLALVRVAARLGRARSRAPRRRDQRPRHCRRDWSARSTPAKARPRQPQLAPMRPTSLRLRQSRSRSPSASSSSRASGSRRST